jgi:uncharacterized membrane protein YraQ (UPF0718 family)
VAVGALLALAVALNLSGLARLASASNFAIVFSSLLIEAVPFIALGAFVSALIEVAVPARHFTRLGALPVPLQLPAAGLAGLAFPVCECGSVPVARRLVAKGLAPGAAVTFMLAAPILNPVVIASTVVAFRGRASLWPIVVGRAGLGMLVAVAVGYVVGRVPAPELVRRRRDDEEHEHERGPRAFFATSRATSSSWRASSSSARLWRRRCRRSCPSPSSRASRTPRS